MGEQEITTAMWWPLPALPFFFTSWTEENLQRVEHFCLLLPIYDVSNSLQKGNTSESIRNAKLSPYFLQK